MIITRTPFRVSLVGGGTDLPAWYRERGGAVVGFALDRYCYISARRLPPFFEHASRIVHSKIELVHRASEVEHPAVRAVLQSYGAEEVGLEVHHFADLPARAGLGSSSSFTVGLIHALRALLEDRSTNKRRLADMAIDVEQNVMGEAVGSQDQIHAAYGGFNRIDFGPGDAYRVSPVVLPAARLEELLSHLMLVFTGFQRYAVEVERRKIAAINAHERQLDRLARAVDAAELILSEGEMTDLGHLLHATWMEKRELAHGVSSDAVDEIYDRARAAGAIGGKLLGAGGGGFMLLFVEPASRATVREALRGLIEVGVGIDRDGSRIVVYEPNGL